MSRAIPPTAGRLVAGGLVLVAVVLVAVLSWPSSSTEATVDRTAFVEHPLDTVADEWMFDLGVADVDADGWMDLFTTNHNARMNLELGDGALGFTDAVSALGFDQSPAFPGWDVPSEPPAVPSGPAPALALTQDGHDLHLALRAETGAAVGATLELFAATTAQGSPGIDVATTGWTDAAGRERTTVTVRGEQDGTVTIVPSLVGMPIGVAVASPTSPSSVAIGPEGLHPTTASFTLELRDRHGVAWADLDDDGDTDALVARGGLKDEIARFPGVVADELMVMDRGRMVDQAAASGMEKRTCRARQAAWADLDGDGDLDLTIGCQGAELQLYEQARPLGFVDHSNGIDALGYSDAFVWLDLVGDARPELIGVEGGVVKVWGAAAPWSYDVVQQLDLRDPGEVTRLGIIDVDGNGTPDLTAAGPKRTWLLVNDGAGRLTAKEANDVGLPGQAVLFDPVDADADGRTDVFAWPGGLYRQGDDGRFSRVADLPADVPTEVQHARTAWFDGDGDGDRDLVFAAARRADRDWDVRLFEHALPAASGAHTLELALVGPAGNAPAIGASVEVTVGGRRQVHWVGESEASRFGQGNEHLYVGLGAAAGADDVRIRWPDGTERDVGPLAAGRHRLGHDGADGTW